MAQFALTYSILPMRRVQERSALTLQSPQSGSGHDGPIAKTKNKYVSIRGAECGKSCFNNCISNHETSPNLELDPFDLTIYIHLSMNMQMRLS